MYDVDNIRELINYVGVGSSKTLHPHNIWEKLRTDLQVHTQGKLFEKVVSVFHNEDPNATKFVLNTYEPITKGSVWKGIDNVARIFKNTGFDISTDADTINFLNDGGYKDKIIENFVNLSIAKDPNTFAVPYYKDGFWDVKFIESENIDKISKDSIVYIDDEKSDYEVKTKHSNALVKLKATDALLLETKEKLYQKKSHVYVSENQYITIDYEDGKAITNIINFEKKIIPYVATGVNKQLDNVYESPVQGFIPFGNKALLQHRTAVSVENLYGYPRMSEIELPCDTCHSGVIKCDITEACPSGEEECKKCSGTGSVTLQSIFKIYKRKLSAENPELNVNIDPVKFHTPDIGILHYVAEAWQKSLQLAEDAIYVQQRIETGNVESAKSREKQLEQMYSWLDRISAQFYESAEQILTNISLLNGYSEVSVQKPISFAIMNELESFEYLNIIVSSDSPIFIKTTHIENFLKKYISSSNPIIRVVEILKKVDLFCFYTSKDLQTLSNSGVIDDKDWRVHAYAFPLLSQMYAMDSQLFELSDEQIIVRLNKELERYLPKVDLLSNLGQEAGGNKLSQTVGGLQGVIEIAKAIATGMYDLEAGIKLVSSLYEVSEDVAKEWLGTPQISNSNELEKVQTII